MTSTPTRVRRIGAAAAGALAVAAAAAVFAASPAQAATAYYVSPSGSDSNSGTSASSPFRTIQKALDVAPSSSVINLASGTYLQDAVTRRDLVKITGPRSAVVKGGGNSRIFQVQHDSITLDGFTIDGLHGSPDSASGYRDKLIYAMSTVAGNGVGHLRVLNMALRNAGGECLRMRYLIHDSYIEDNTIGPCGVHDFQFGGGGKNGEAIYIGTAPEQQGENGAPDDRRDVSKNNYVRRNVINTAGNECVDVKENSTLNRIEHNDCTGQQDPNSGGMDSRGSGNYFRFNTIHDNVGAGVRLGGDTATDGIDNYVYSNTITGNDAGGIKFMATPQNQVCGNTMSGNTGGNSVGTYGDQFNPTAACP